MTPEEIHEQQIELVYALLGDDQKQTGRELIELLLHEMYPHQVADYIVRMSRQPKAEA